MTLTPSPAVDGGCRTESPGRVRTVASVAVQPIVSSAQTAVEAVVQACVHALPGVQHVAVGVVERNGAVRTAAANGELAQHLTELQCTLEEGPVIDVIRHACPMELVQCGDACRWPEFGVRAQTRGVRSALAARLAWEGRTLGALGIYSTEEASTLRSAAEVIAPLAGHAAATLAFARKAEQLEIAMLTRQQIGQAVGILMERYGLSSDAAFNYLKRRSQEGNIKLRELAKDIVASGPPAPAQVPGVN